MQLVLLSAGFQSLPPLPTANLALLVLIPRWGVCVHSRTLWVSKELSCEAGSFFRCCLNPTGVFSQRFEALFPLCWSPGLQVCLAPQLFLPVYPHMNVGPPSLPAVALLPVLCTQLPISAPPTGLYECVFFNFLVVRLPYSSIFWNFWLFFVFKLLLSFFWLCKEAACLPTPPPWLEVPSTKCLFILISFDSQYKNFLIQQYSLHTLGCTD